MTWLRQLARWCAALLLLCPLAARADDIGAAARGVVRVVSIAVVDGQVVGFGHGSGFAVAPNRIVTNAHVVELAQRYPDNVVIGVVPSEGAKSFRAHVIAYDARRDLALLEFEGTPLPPETLSTGAASPGDAVIALGYPGNVDLATARSAADYIHPTVPVRSQGGISGARVLEGTQVLLHTANIARGNSGGPLLDPCGRVLGVNSAITRGEEGDATFGFAIAQGEVAGFLRDAHQPYASIGSPCTSMEDRVREDSESDARALATAAEARREAETRAILAREEEIARLRAEADRARETIMALAALMLVAGAQGLGAAGWLNTLRRREAAAVSAGIGALLVVGAVLVFLNRPTDTPVPPPIPSVAAVVAGDAALGRLQCRLVPDKSRVTVSSSADVSFSWGRHGCVDGRTPFVSDGARWTSVQVPDGDETVSVLSFDPALRRYAVSHYFLGADAMASARAARGTAPAPVCGGGYGADAALAGRQSAIRATLPPLPNEKLVYDCTPAR